MDSLRLARVARGVAVAAAIGAVGGVAVTARGETNAAGQGTAARPTPANAAAAESVVVVADRDDDDVDGVPDGEAARVGAAAAVDVVPVDRALVGAEVTAVSGRDRVRVVAPPGAHGAAGGAPVAWGKVVPPGAAIQGISPGIAELVFRRGATERHVVVRVIGLGLADGAGRDVDWTRSHASIARTPPTRAPEAGDAPFEDPDALRVVVALPAGTEVARIDVESISASGTSMDRLSDVALAPSRCPGDAPAVAALRCVATAPLRFVIDDVDRSHPAVAGRSLRAEVGGAIVVRDGVKKLQAVRVLGPRGSAVGPIGRLRARVRPFVLRVVPGGAPAIGGNDAGAAALVRTELAVASSIWGQCGITLGSPATLDVRVVDPPRPHLLALGDELGLPASGGVLRFRAEGHPITVTVARGATPEGVALAVARALDAAGLVAILSPNARVSPGAAASVDVLVRRNDGKRGTGGAAASADGSDAPLATLEALPGIPLTTDATLTARIGAVDLTDGLQHFGDMDSMAGTLEERTLLKALDDGDPATIELVVVPRFAGGGRIGESFIASDLSSLRDVVLVDRGGIRARKSSLTFAHELGHVLLDVPGHPDEYGVDTPTRLMDSDASDASAFGPRRLTLDECARAMRQSGPAARVPLLVPWPVERLVY